MNFTVLTIFPEMMDAFWQNGMIKRAIENKIIAGSSVNIRDFANGKHRATDDKPYGGGSGMVMKPEPLTYAIKKVREDNPDSKVISLSPQGKSLNKEIVRQLSHEKGLIFVCGRYEGLDERIYPLIDEEISIGDYVLTGGELAAMVVIDSVARFVPGVLGSFDSAENDTFENGLVEHAHYTRPPEFNGAKVPEVLLSGNHKNIDEWRLETSLKRTFLKRPDLLEKRIFSDQEKEILKSWCKNIEKIIE
ncbi:MAG: tRNA (guanosine(37)-N1)-methyltransferase TrmD [Deltaproteobacteria bacterium]|nr:tRNA (guanosine(37)-N1)-methyltransferase TrmD [Deltaproteobacteria bacterium]